MTAIQTRPQDRYPTRGGTRTELAPRTDPTVWQGIDTGPARPAELESHDRNGFHVVSGLLGADEIAGQRRELHRMQQDPALRLDERTIVEPGSEAVRSIFEVHRLSRRVAALVRDPRVLGRARQILGSEVYVHQSRINSMPGFAGKGFYWHSDFETWHAEDGMPLPRAVSVSIALTDNYPFNGGLMLMPGAHRTYVCCGGYTPEDNYKSSLSSQQVGVPAERDIETLAAEHGIEQFTGRAGDALWFDCNSMHASGNNITPFPRANIFIVFNSVHNEIGEPFAAAGPRPDFIAGRDTRPVRPLN
ncbi:MAG: ectoine hydroxylase [Sciscionella sp.]